MRKDAAGKAMIELRFLERKIQLPPEANIYGGHPTERVLQYRVQEMMYEQLYDVCVKWSDWREVPTVREENE